MIIPCVALIQILRPQGAHPCSNVPKSSQVKIQKWAQTRRGLLHHFPDVSESFLRFGGPWHIVVFEFKWVSRQLPILASPQEGGFGPTWLHPQTVQKLILDKKCWFLKVKRLSSQSARLQRPQKYVRRSVTQFPMVRDGLRQLWLDFSWKIWSRGCPGASVRLTEYCTKAGFGQKMSQYAWKSAEVEIRIREISSP